MVDDDEPVPTDPGGEPADPQVVAPRRAAPPAWVRRLGVAAALLAAVAVLVLGSQRNEVGKTAAEKDAVVRTQIPAPGAKALRQTSVGAELETGFDGRLVVNGVAIPEDQMEGAIDPKSVSASDLKKFGIRPNNRNRVFFTPGPGKVIKEFGTGTVEIRLTYFKDRQSSASGRTVTWTVTVD